MTPALVSYLRLTLERHGLTTAGFRDTDDVAVLLEQLGALRNQMDSHERALMGAVDRLLARYEP